MLSQNLVFGCAFCERESTIDDDLGAAVAYRLGWIVATVLGVCFCLVQFFNLWCRDESGEDYVPTLCVFAPCWACLWICTSYIALGGQVSCHYPTRMGFPSSPLPLHSLARRSSTRSVSLFLIIRGDGQGWFGGYGSAGSNYINVAKMPDVAAMSSSYLQYNFATGDMVCASAVRCEGVGMDLCGSARIHIAPV
jgi:hypothetical protein